MFYPRNCHQFINLPVGFVNSSNLHNQRNLRNNRKIRTGGLGVTLFQGGSCVISFVVQSNRYLRCGKELDSAERTTSLPLKNDAEREVPIHSFLGKKPVSRAFCC